MLDNLNACVKLNNLKMVLRWLIDLISLLTSFVKLRVNKEKASCCQKQKKMRGRIRQNHSVNDKNYFNIIDKLRTYICLKYAFYSTI